MKTMGNKQMTREERAQRIKSNLSFGEVMDAAELVSSCKDYKGVPVLEKYRDDPLPLLGIAYMMGVAEGKRQERERRRLRGKLPTE